ncbi:MAG: hypothetical protein K9M98_03845 [Cephaloticoccus sp.]|nr:hypothetical protein [Cephaloticoccus sp.]MCF7759615.1 hypothetical protein [Cephaloticoccus sp.]
MNRFPLINPGLGLVALLTGIFAATVSANPPPETSGEAPVPMDPYSVSALFPAIEVRFVLTGQNLTDPTNDKIVKAYISAVVQRSAESGPELLTGDSIAALNGEPFKGKTLIEVAAMLRQARSQGIPKWSLQRGWQTIEVPFDGDWLVPLPGLKR